MIEKANFRLYKLYHNKKNSLLFQREKNSPKENPDKIILKQKNFT